MIKRTIFLFALVGLVIALILQMSSGPATTTHIGLDQPVFVQLTGYSMYPTIKNGETKPCEVENSYCVGDVVAFNCDSQIISHRIVGEMFGKYITKGDNNIIPDLKLVDASSVICKVQTNAGKSL
jgi:signal peptidase I